LGHHHEHGDDQRVGRDLRIDQIKTFTHFYAKNTYAIDAGKLLGHHHEHGDDQGLAEGRVDEHLLQGHLRDQLHAFLQQKNEK
jgi:hypothetical protein